jgi:hypothetical protein
MGAKGSASRVRMEAVAFEEHRQGKGSLPLLNAATDGDAHTN